jgi:hypothetical protein
VLVVAVGVKILVGAVVQVGFVQQLLQQVVVEI